MTTGIAPPGTTLGPILMGSGLTRHFVVGPHTVKALSGVDLQVAPGSFLAVRGRSGSGKTTLLNLLGGLDKPTAGTVLIDGADITDMDDEGLVEIRRHKVGYIFQAFGLIPILSALENVQIPMRLTRVPVAERGERARVLLEMVGLGARANHRPHELSGGEQQRVAIARALANTPRVLLADEPTGQLDSRTGRSIVELIHTVVRSENVAAVVATHDPAPLAVADRVIELKDGRIAAAE